MRVGIIGDVHLPFEHPHYLEFCLDTFSMWKVEHIHLIGDVVDGHALSFHEHDPNGHSAADEALLAKEKLKVWKKRLKSRQRGKKVTVSIGNHDARHFRMARRYGIPDVYLRSYSDVWDTPDWDWQESHVIDGVLYEHGVGTSGKDGAINRAIQNRCSCVIGHIHSWGGVKFHCNSRDRIFGMNVGCGLSISEYTFAYAKPFPIRPVLGCGVVIDGRWPYFEPMAMGKGEPYYKGRK